MTNFTKIYRRDGTGRRDHFEDGFVFPSRPAVTAVTIPPKYRDKPWIIGANFSKTCFVPGTGSSTKIYLIQRLLIVGNAYELLLFLAVFLGPW